MGYVTLMAPCFFCGKIFGSNPHKVPSVKVRNGVPDANGIREPVCKACVERLNKKLAAEGRPGWTVTADAYEAIEESEL